MAESSTRPFIVFPIWKVGLVFLHSVETIGQIVKNVSSECAFLLYLLYLKLEAKTKIIFIYIQKSTGLTSYYPIPLRTENLYVAIHRYDGISVKNNLTDKNIKSTQS